MCSCTFTAVGNDRDVLWAGKLAAIFTGVGNFLGPPERSPHESPYRASHRESPLPHCAPEGVPPRKCPPTRPPPSALECLTSASVKLTPTHHTYFVVLDYNYMYCNIKTVILIVNLTIAIICNR